MDLIWVPAEVYAVLLIELNQQNSIISKAAFFVGHVTAISKKILIVGIAPAVKVQRGQNLEDKKAR